MDCQSKNRWEQETMNVSRVHIFFNVTGILVSKPLQVDLITYLRLS